MGAVQVLGGRYELGVAVGHGTSTQTFRARDTVLDRVVAVRLPQGRAASVPDDPHGPAAGLRARFLTELELAPLLHHPAIAAVYDAGEADLGPATLPFEVVEFVDGRAADIALILDRTSLAHRAAEITDSVLQALEHCHGNQIAHGRVIPGNVMLGRDGQVKLINFGVAAAFPGSAVTRSTIVRSTVQLTLEAAPYLAPEILQGASASDRSDIYSAGCLLYALLTGAPPYIGEAVLSVPGHVTAAPRGRRPRWPGTARPGPTPS